MKYTWDPAKAARNLAKYGVSFEEAQTVFDDLNCAERPDNDNADGELRTQVIGFSAKPRLLFVLVFQVHESLTRIIGARCTTTKEENRYAKQNQK